MGNIGVALGNIDIGIGPALVILGLFSLLGIVGIVWLYVWANRSTTKTRKSVEQWAVQQGWGLSTDASLPFDDELPGRRGRAKLLMHSTVNGRPVAVADYYYDTTESFGSDGDSREVTKSVWVMAVRLPRSYPLLSLERRPGPVSRAFDIVLTVLSPVAMLLGKGLGVLKNKVFGPGPVSVALGYPPFDDKFVIKASDPELARRLFGPTLVAEHVAGRVPMWSLLGPDLFTWTNQIKDGQEMSAKVAGLLRVADLLGR
jgi:hypothetical protein